MNDEQILDEFERRAMKLRDFMGYPTTDGVRVIEGVRALLAASASAEPVAWRHSKTHCLFDTEEEVPLADGDEWAEPLYLAPRPIEAPENKK